MNKYKKMLERVAKKLNINFSDIEFGTQVLADGTSIFFLEDEIALEIQIFTNEDMTEVLSDGVYTVDENFSFEIIDGIVGVINKEEVEAPVDEVVEELEEEVIEEAPTEEVVEDERTFNSIELADGSLIYFIEDELVEGISVFSDELMETPLVDGAYVLVDGNTLNLVDGKITTIEIAELDGVNFGEIISGDWPTGSKIYFVEDELIEGISVFVDSEKTNPLSDGNYRLSDKREIVVKEGILVALISNDEPENENLKEELSKLKLTLKDVDKQLEDEIKKNESLEKTKIELKKQIDNKPAVDSIKLTDEEIVVNEKVDIRANREMARQMLISIKK